MLMRPLICKLTNLTFYSSVFTIVAISPISGVFITLPDSAFTGITRLFCLILENWYCILEIVPVLLIVSIVKAIRKPILEYKKYYNYFVNWLFIKFLFKLLDEERKYNNIILFISLRGIYIFTMLCLQIGAAAGTNGCIFSIYDVCGFFDDPFLFTNISSFNATPKGFIYMNYLGGSSGSNIGGSNQNNPNPGGPQGGNEGILGFRSNNYDDEPEVVRVGYQNKPVSTISNLFHDRVQASGNHDCIRHLIHLETYIFDDKNWEYFAGVFRDHLPTRTDLKGSYIVDRASLGWYINLVKAEEAIHMVDDYRPEHKVDLWNRDPSKGELLNVYSNSSLTEVGTTIEGRPKKGIFHWSGNMRIPVRPRDILYISNHPGKYIEYDPKKHLHADKWLYLGLNSDFEGNFEKPSYFDLKIRAPRIPKAASDKVYLGDNNEVKVNHPTYRSPIMAKKYIDDRYKVSRVFRPE